MDIANYSADSRAAIKNAKEVAAAFKHPEITIEHLFLALVRQVGTEVESILNQLGKSPAFCESVIETHLKDQSSRSSARDNLSIGPSVQAALEQANIEKSNLSDPLVEPEHILLAIIDPKSSLAAYVREKLDIVKDDILKALAESQMVEEIAAGPKPAGGGASGEPAKKSSGSLRYCSDMTNLAASGKYDPMIGRDDEVQQVIQILLRRRKNSPVLVGGAGVGKSAIVEGFAQAVVDKKVPKALYDAKVMEVDMGAMVAGAKYKGEFEERFKSLISEVVKTAGRTILFVDEIHTLMGAGSGSGGMDAANLIKPALARGQLRVIGATTEEEYTKYIEKDKALVRRFEKVVVDEPSHDEAVRIISGVMPKYQEHHKIEYDPEAIEAAVKYSKRYLSERNLPDIALDVIDEAGSEYAVKEEFAKDKIPQLEKQVADVEALLAKAAVDDSQLEAAEKAVDDFAREVDRLFTFWGHRLDVKEELV